MAFLTLAQARAYNLSPADVAALFSVDSKTVARWATLGHLSSIRTPGGHRRFREDEVMAVLNEGSQVKPTAGGDVSGSTEDAE